ncbi:LegC family aminotransferase [bacterium]|nr:LegC family aminotransferase [bacterium]
MAMGKSIGEKIVKAIKVAVQTDEAALHKPCFNGNEWLYVKECLDSTYVSSVGGFVDRFETDLAAYTGAKYAVAVVNGTAALHIAFLLAGVKPNDEVLIPALTFIATANAVSYCSAIPHFVDCEERTLGLDPRAIRVYLNSISEVRNKQCINRKTGRVIRTLVPMHTFGHPADIEGLMSVAQDFHLTLVEDAAESLGSFVNGQHTGTFGLVGIISFNGNKTITTGGGGVILTNDAFIAKKAKHLTTTAKIPHSWNYVHDEIGYNYRMPNINAALGCAQLEQLPNILKAKRELLKCYISAFKNISGLHIFTSSKGCESNYWLQTLILDKAFAIHRDEFLRETNVAGYMTRPVWNLLNNLEPYKNSPSMNLDVAKSLGSRIINIPSGI